MWCWIRGSGGNGFWHVEKNGPEGKGYTRCGKYLYSPWGLTRSVCERPNELEYRCCKRCDMLTMKDPGS
jgi:hypothetical protein